MRRKNNLKALTQISLAAALLSVSAWITLGGAIPITAQTLTLSLILILLGGKKGAIATALYILIGATGVPVYAGFSGGVGHLFSESGGFIFGFLALALVYLLVTGIFGDGAISTVSALVLGTCTLYLLGSLWYAALYSGGASFGAILSLTVLPYLLPDALKLTLAVLVGRRLKRYIK